MFTAEDEVIPVIGTGPDIRNSATITKTVPITDNLFPLRIHSDGWQFVAISSSITLLLILLWWPLAILGLLLTMLCLYFFRDPQRTTPCQAGLIVSPADGVIQALSRAPPPPELDMESTTRLRISVFMSILDCHVNRVPAEGTILKTVYRSGRFVNASFDKASEDNERHSVRLLLPDSRDIAFVQIAGLIARRIRCDLRDGMTVKAGERFGLIRFGSRVDIYLPDDVTPLVTVGQAAIAGETILADLNVTFPSPSLHGGAL